MVRDVRSDDGVGLSRAAPLFKLRSRGRACPDKRTKPAALCQRIHALSGGGGSRSRPFISDASSSELSNDTPQLMCTVVLAADAALTRRARQRESIQCQQAHTWVPGCAATRGPGVCVQMVCEGYVCGTAWPSIVVLRTKKGLQCEGVMCGPTQKYVVGWMRISQHCRQPAAAAG